MKQLHTKNANTGENRKVRCFAVVLTCVCINSKFSDKNEEPQYCTNGILVLLNSTYAAYFN